MSKIDECDLATDVVKSVTILVALRWVALAWSEAKPETNTKCLRKAGILNDGLDVVGLDSADGSVDPFAALDGVLDLQHLIEQTGSESCTPQEFVGGDDDLPVCAEMDNENWEKTFFDELSEREADVASQEMDEDDELDDGPVVPKLKKQSIIWKMTIFGAQGTWK